MYQKLLKNIQARIQSKEKRPGDNDDGGHENTNHIDGGGGGAHPQSQSRNDSDSSTSLSHTSTNSNSLNGGTISGSSASATHINHNNNNNNNNNNNTNADGSAHGGGGGNGSPNHNGGGHAQSGGGGGGQPSSDMEDEKDEYCVDDLLTPEASLRDVVSAEERKALFVKKLKLCCIIFDFNRTDVDENDQLAKEMKRTYLLELVEYISQSKHWFSEDCVPVILEMIASNLFRSLPPPIFVDFDPEEDEPNFDPSWPHLQFVYEFFHRFVMTADVKVIRRYIDKRFLLNMIDLFNSEDPRERDYLKMILHRIYGRCMPFRSFIRKAMNNILYPIIYNSKRHNGVSELLEILGSIINGFALPLKEEHTRFLRNVLIPMHKVLTLSQFHAQLAYCVTQFIQKDPTLASVVIGGMLKFWPQVSCQKELLYLNELEEVLELTGAQQLEKVIEPLFYRIGCSICSHHFQVAERALFLWNNDIIATFTSDHRQRILPIIYPALQQNYTKHWNSTVSSLTLNIIRIFKEMDKELYEEVAKKFKNSKSANPEQIEFVRKAQWTQIHEQSILTSRKKKNNNTGAATTADHNNEDSHHNNNNNNSNSTKKSKSSSNKSSSKSKASKSKHSSGDSGGGLLMMSNNTSSSMPKTNGNTYSSSSSSSSSSSNNGNTHSSGDGGGGSVTENSSGSAPDTATHMKHEYQPSDIHMS